MNELGNFLEDSRRVIDAKVVKIRQEFDIQALKKLISRKAEERDIIVAMEQQDEKTKMLDSNVLMLANDMETF